MLKKETVPKSDKHSIATKDNPATIAGLADGKIILKKLSFAEKYDYIYPNHQSSSFSNYGGVGLIQMPSARMQPASSLAFSWADFDPYLRGSIVAYPFSWFEASYQYTDINNALYSNSPGFSGNQTYKDKSFDAKILLFEEKSIMPFSVLLNLVGTSNANDKDVLWKFIKKNKKDIKVSEHPILDSLVGYALRYFEDVVKPNKKYRKPNDKEKKALQDLVKRLKDCKEQMDPEAIQTIVYSVGKDNGYKENLREWFKAIYEIIFGDQDGPRMGFFISFFGIKESIELINKYIK